MKPLFYMLCFAVPIGYLVCTGVYWRLFYQEAKPKPRRATWILLLVFALHALLLVSTGLLNQRFPFGTGAEGLLFCAWLVAASHLVSEYVARSRHLGIFSLLPTTLAVLLAITGISPDAAIPEKYAGALFSLHLVASLTAYSCFTLGAIIATMYLLLFRKLKTKRFDVLYRRLPPLDKLEVLTLVWIYIGSGFMFLTGFLGWYWSHSTGQGEGMSPKEALIFVVLAAYLALALGRSFRGLRGSRFAAGSLVCFGLFLLIQLINAHGFNF